MKNFTFKDFIKLLILGGIIYIAMDENEANESEASIRHKELIEQVTVQKQELDSIVNLYSDEKLASKKTDENIIKEIKEVKFLLKSYNEKISHDKKKLKEASDDANVHYFIDYTNEHLKRSNTKQ